MEELKYRQTLINVLTTMIADADQHCEHMDNISSFELLFKSADDMRDAGIINKAEHDALVKLYNELYVMTAHPDLPRVWTNKQFPIAPDWEPSRMAARDALREFEREHN